MRVLAVAERDFDPQTFDPQVQLLDEVKDLTFLALVGIVDPPRAEAKAAIAECKAAGIRTRMITGDYAVTAAAIAQELGIKGKAITGAEFAKMSDEEAASQVDDIGVIARVAPKDKVRLVQVLQAKNNIVAMTGDGVNDAPALKAANIGVAMGITGTDVSKEAAAMILADDNFATIVGAVEQGRIIYDNLLKYIRFQMAGLVGFVLAFLGSALFGIAGTALFTPVQILYVNFLVDAVIGVALGFDTPTPGLMQKKPRPADKKIITAPLAIRLSLVGLLNALFALLSYTWAENNGYSASAQTMALVMFSVLHIAVALNLRYPVKSAFRMETFSNAKLLFAFGGVLLGLILITEIDLFQQIFKTTSLTTQQWAICLGATLLLFLLGEALKFVLRIAESRDENS
jgi:Ca2+-transporting ATPase